MKPDPEEISNDSSQEIPKSFADELEDRWVNFAVSIIKLVAKLPRTPAGKQVSGQILRSGTSPVPNYGEARGAESRADLTHKIRIVLKELNETLIWLRIIERSEMLPAASLSDISTENLARKIFTSSLNTIRSGRKSQLKNVKS